MSGCVDCGEIMDEERVDTMPFCDLCYRAAAISHGDPQYPVKRT